MKKIILTTLLIIITQISFAQVEVRLEGDINDSTFLAKVEKMKAAGFTVIINEEDPFIARHTDNELPSFDLTDLNGNRVRSEELIGKKIHINIWSTTCKPCIEEFPELNRLKSNYEDKDYIFIGLAPESDKKIKKLLAKRPFKYTIIPNAKAYIKEIGVDAFPVNFFVDKDGIIREIIDGARYKMELIDGKEKLVPDNYEGYEEALKSI